VIRPWFEQAFQAQYLELYAHRDAAEAERVLRMIFPPPALKGVQVADVACGGGRYLAALEKEGAWAVGLDLSGDLLRQAREVVPRARLVRCDMRRIPLADRGVDWVLSLFTSFGYFETVSEHRALLGEMSRVARVGVVLDIPNPAPLLRGLVPFSRRETGGLRVEEKRRLETEPLRVVKEVRLTRKSDGQLMEYEERVMLFTPGDLEEMTKASRLVLDRRWGDYEGGAFDEEESPRQILRLRKEKG